MAEFDSAERVSTYLEEYDTDVMTGDRDKRMYLYYQLVNSMKRADRIDIIVSFLMESGVKMLLKDLDQAMKRGAKIRILTGNYLGITQPSALYLIKHELGENVDLRFTVKKADLFIRNLIFSIMWIIVIFILALRSVYKELHADHETGAADNK